MPQDKSINGIDHFLQKKPENKAFRFGLVTNDAALTANGMPTRAALLKNGIRLVRLFSPEHGLSRNGEDGAFQSNRIDHLTGLPDISLYGDKMRPKSADLADIDAILFDIPDVGCRFYTYLWTLTYIMEACAENGKKLIVFDRPNPIGIDLHKAEGPFLDEQNCSSFIGRWRMPLKHACTLGELCNYFAGTRLPKLDFAIIPVKNYKRSQKDHNFEFTPTSPAMPNRETAKVYPGMGLLEGININEGRGTPFPFRQCGAPWLNAQFLLEKVGEMAIPGIKFTKTNYTPVSGLYAGEICHGLKWKLTEMDDFMAVQAGIQLLKAIFETNGNEVAERSYKTLANPSGSGHLDKLLGISGAFSKFKNGAVIDTRAAGWEEEIAKYRLY